MFNDLERYRPPSSLEQKLRKYRQKKEDGVMHLGSAPDGSNSEELWQEEIDRIEHLIRNI